MSEEVFCIESSENRWYKSRKKLATAVIGGYAHFRTPEGQPGHPRILRYVAGGTTDTGPFDVTDQVREMYFAGPNPITAGGWLYKSEEWNNAAKHLAKRLEALEW